MKQDILCVHCNSYRILLCERYNEKYKSVKGIALDDYKCDSCYPASEIKKGDECYAFSQWLPHAPYFPWEDNYIDQS